MITACECGSKNFYMTASREINMELEEDGTLKMTTEDDLGMDGVIFCSACNKEYLPKDFKEIV